MQYNIILVVASTSKSRHGAYRSTSTCSACEPLRQKRKEARETLVFKYCK